MKGLWKIALLFLIIFAIYFYFDNQVQENQLLESPVNHGTALPVEEEKQPSLITTEMRPTEGLSVLVGKSVDVVREQLGEPNRIEPSEYGYDWWVYSFNKHVMIGVKDEIVNQVYSADTAINMSPFKIGQDMEDVYRFTLIESEIDVAINDNIYSFSLNGEDMKNRILIQYDQLFAQVYIDEIDKEVEAVRFIDPLTLVKHQPYDMAYHGELVNKKMPSSTAQKEVNRAMERQIFELTNIFRNKHLLDELKLNYRLSNLARQNSEEMLYEKVFSKEPEEALSYADRLKEWEIEHKKAGQNVAFNYVDAIEVVHGWLNSPTHRKVMFEKDMTHSGVGVYGKYYTQNLIQVEEKE